MRCIQHYVFTIFTCISVSWEDLIYLSFLSLHISKLLFIIAQKKKKKKKCNDTCSLMMVTCESINTGIFDIFCNYRQSFHLSLGVFYILSLYCIVLPIIALYWILHPNQYISSTFSSTFTRVRYSSFFIWCINTYYAWSVF